MPRSGGSSDDTEGRCSLFSETASSSTVGRGGGLLRGSGPRLLLRPRGAACSGSLRSDGEFELDEAEVGVDLEMLATSVFHYREQLT